MTRTVHLQRIPRSANPGAGTRPPVWDFAPQAFLRDQHIDAVPWARAVLCEDCHMVTGHPQRCPICGSDSLTVLAKVLDREDRS